MSDTTVAMEQIGVGINLRRCPVASSGPTSGPRPLLLLFGWLFSQDRHLDRYRKLYYQQGFDVLTIQNTTLRLLFPTHGVHVTCHQVVDFLRDHHHSYPYILVHGFSVGGYTFCEFLLELEKDAKLNEVILDKMKGMIMDSGVDADDFALGLGRALTNNLVVAKVIQILAAMFLFLFYFTSTIHYKTASKMAHDLKIRCPALLIVSKVDQAGSLESNQRVANDMKRKDISVTVKVFESSEHVSHMHKYPDEYEKTMLDFVESVRPKK
ncbi:Transmembrane protein 53 [Halotydeus destructor]|nr:Transmembrane protein 53 [Halotydeus destructor]